MTEDEKTGKVLTPEDVKFYLEQIIALGNCGTSDEVYYPKIMNHDAVQRSMLDQKDREIERLGAEIKEWCQYFHLYDRAVRALTAHWHAHNPDATPLTLPDTGKLCAWIVKELESKDAEIERMQRVVDKAILYKRVVFGSDGNSSRNEKDCVIQTLLYAIDDYLAALDALDKGERT